MKDTSPDIQNVYRELLMSKSGSDRLKMASDMFDSARTLVRCNLKSKNLSNRELEWQTFLRIYKRDFDKSTLDKIFARYFSSE